MNQKRINELQSLASANPHEPSILYNLANEYGKNDPYKAMSIFEQLFENHEDFLPMYMDAARLYEVDKQFSKAMGIYEKGLGIAMLQRNNEVYKDLQKAYHTLALQLEL